MKSMYLVVVSQDERDRLAEKIPEQDRCMLTEDSWFMLSELSTTAELADNLGFNAKAPGIVVSAKFYSGWAEARITEKVRQWEDAHAD